MTKVIKIKQGYSINLVGKPEEKISDAPKPKTFAVLPKDFRYQKFKVKVQVGDEVKAGTPLIFDKDQPEIVVCAPVSGEIVEIRRGDKRVLEAIIILADNQTSFVQHDVKNPERFNREQIIAHMCETGVWPLLRQRPFSKVPRTTDTAKAIIISTFDTAPNAPSIEMLIEGETENFKTGIAVINKLSPKTYLTVNQKTKANAAFAQANGVELVQFEGPHPAGNIGIQIHHLNPINKNEQVWYLTPMDLVTIGRLFNKGIYDPQKVIATTCGAFEKTQYWRTRSGAELSVFIHNNLKDGDNRLIVGNVLTGRKADKNDYLSFYDYQLSAIPEGKKLELFGWLLPHKKRPDISKTFFWNKNQTFEIDTNTHGEVRNFVVSGQYEEVLPMDIYPVFLLKSILAGDVEEMEQLGIYEVSEEDFALCEFVCTSKTPVQQIIRQGLDLMIEEG